MSYQSSSSSAGKQQNQNTKSDELVLSDEEAILLDDIEAATKRIYNQVSFAVTINVKLKALSYSLGMKSTLEIPGTSVDRTVPIPL